MNLSVVIPAYNAGEYLKRCIESILTNNIVNQIIIVDDGSKDNTEEIACRIRESMDNDIITYIKQANAGPAFARLNGLQHVRNEFVTFVDSDDFVVSGGYDRLFADYEISKWEIVEFSYYTTTEKGDQISVIKKRKKKLFLKQCATTYLKEKSTNFLWDKIFNVKLFKDIVTSKIYYAEDALWLSQAFLRAEHYLIVKDICCAHTINPNGLCGSTYNEHTVDNINSWIMIKDIYSNSRVDLLPLINLKLCSLAILLYVKCPEEEKTKYLELFEKFRKEVSFAHILRYGSMKRKIMILMFPRFKKFIAKQLR